MKYALRALRWTTIIFWLYFAFLSLTVVYSAFNVRVEIGEFQFFIEDDRIVWAMPFIIDNAGFYNIYDLNMTSIVEDADGTVLIKNSSFNPVIPKERQSILWHNVSINFKEMPNYEIYLTHDSNFTVKHLISLNYAKIIPFSLLFNSTMLWGAPLYNLSISEPTLHSFNATHSKVSFNVSFENHSPYIELNGTMEIKILNENGEVIGVAEESFYAPSGSSWKETIEILVANTVEVTDYVTIKVTFKTSMFSYEMEARRRLSS